MTEHEWLDACADAPDDDLRRYAFADWLEENGDADRAEFIRLTVALSRQESPDPTRKRRAALLLIPHRTIWLGPLADLAPWHDWEFPRGLPEKVRLRFHRRNLPGIREFFSSSHFRRVIALDREANALGEEGTRVFADSPYLARLSTLSLCRNAIENDGARALATSPYLTRLHQLDLSYNYIGAEGAKSLADSPSFAPLTTLNLRCNEVGDAGAMALAKSPYLTALRSLDLRRNEISDRGAEAVVARLGAGVEV